MQCTPALKKEMEKKKHTKRSDLESQSRDKISAPEYIVAFLDADVDESYVQILHHQQNKPDSTYHIKKSQSQCLKK